MLPLTVAAGRAADAAPRAAASEIVSWRESVERPEDFPSLVDGSIIRRGGPADPVQATVAGASGPAGRAPRLPPTHENFRRHQDAVPLPESFGATSAAASATDGDYRLICAGIVALGACFLLAWHVRREVAVPEVLPAAIPSPTPLVPRSSATSCVAPAAPPAAEVAPPALEDEREEPFIDTRCPARTWRAIDWREQALLERWDASREKALGLTSLDEWLDRQGSVAGVDTAMLKAKLARDTV